MKRAIVVTGAAGFIGSCVVRELNNRGFDRLILVDRLGQGPKWKNLVGKSYERFLHKDEALSWLSQNALQISAVIHLGACSSTLETDADYLMKNNTQYSQALAQLAVENEWRFIYASSAATYGDGKLGFEDDESKIQNLCPLNMYGYSKHIFDLWLKKQGLLNRFVGLKFFNVFGPNEWHKGRMSSHVLKMVDQVREGRIKLFRSNDPGYSDGGQMRDFIYVKDIARMVCDLLDTSHAGLYNLGLGKPHTWNELAQATIEAMNSNAVIEYIDMPQDLIGQYQNYTCATMDKWQSVGLELPRWELKESVKDYVQNHLLTKQTW
jgi:ADP-L-glycero-D-manno-heptose 6-epimerase